MQHLQTKSSLKGEMAFRQMTDYGWWMASGMIFMLLGSSLAQSPSWVWVQIAGQNGSSSSHAVASDASGNVYLAGWFTSPTLTFGSTTLISKGSADFLVVKYDASGNLLWARSGGGNDWDWARGITVDGNGNVYVTGRFSSDSLVLGTDTLVRAGQDDIFIAKYDPNGNLLWARRIGGTDRDGSTGMAADANGNVYVVGWFWSSTLSFGSLSLSDAGGTIPVDVFVAKYDASGNVLWAKRAGGIDVEVANGVAVDGSNNAYVTGRFRSSSVTFGTTTLNNVGSDDIFIVKYDPNGNVLWAKAAGGNGIDEAFAVATDGSGNVYITGEYGSTTLNFSSSTALNNTGDYDFFIAKYDPNGNVLWAKGATGSGRDVAYGVAADASGNVFAAGRFTSSSVTFGSVALANQGNDDIFLVGYDSNGDMLWAMSVGAGGSDEAKSIAIGGSANAYIAGNSASSALSFGSIPLNGSGGFVAKLGGLTSGGVGKAGASLTFEVFPIPTTGQLTLHLGEKQSGPFHVELYNTRGERLYEQWVRDIPATGTIQLNLTDLPAGVYALRLVGDGAVGIQRVVIL